MQETESNCLVIPDIHQNVTWAERILSLQADSCRRIVFLGDYFDAKLKTATSAVETARFLVDLPQRFPEHSFTFLVGNHDLPYLYGLQRRSGYLNPYSNSAFEDGLVPELRAIFTGEFLNRFEPFILEQGYLLSHAGLHESFLPQADLTKLESLQRSLKQDLTALPETPPPALAAVGIARGGLAPVGGLTWQDWYQEFEDTLPWPQIVGHTILSVAGRDQRSWNLDSRSGNYATLQAGRLYIHDCSKE